MATAPPQSLPHHPAPRSPAPSLYLTVPAAPRLRPPHSGTPPVPVSAPSGNCRTPGTGRRQRRRWRCPRCRSRAGSCWRGARRWPGGPGRGRRQGGSVPLSSPRRRPPPSSSRGPSTRAGPLPPAHTPARSANPRGPPRPAPPRPANPGGRRPPTNGQSVRRLPSPGSLREGAGKEAWPMPRRGGAGRVSGQRSGEGRGRCSGACLLLANRVSQRALCKRGARGPAPGAGVAGLRAGREGGGRAAGSGVSRAAPAGPRPWLGALPARMVLTGPGLGAQSRARDHGCDEPRLAAGLGARPSSRVGSSRWGHSLLPAEGVQGGGCLCGGEPLSAPAGQPRCAAGRAGPAVRSGGSRERSQCACERVCLPRVAGIVRSDESGFLGSMLMHGGGVCN